MLDGGSILDDFDGTEGEAASLQEMKPVGPVSDAFIQDTSFIRGIMGPYGSAKTTSCFQAIIWSAIRQKPGRDGVRRVRWCVIRDTYSQLQSNVMNDFFQWFPKTKENFNGDRNDSNIDIDLPGYGRIHIEIFWRALGDENKPEKVFKGMALTGLWLNEADTLNPQVLKYGLPRVGRYPLAKDGGCTWSGVIADFNAPEVTNWTYELFVDKKLPLEPAQEAELREVYGDLVKFFRQPGGRDPNAENLDNLPKGYYAKMAIGLSENDQRRFIDNEFGAVRNGQPVYPEFNDEFHVAKHELKPIPELPLYLALDGGSTPAAAIGQKMPDGQIRLIDELVIMSPDDDSQLAKMGPRAFGKSVREYVNEHYPDCIIGEIWADPATAYGDYSDEHEEDLSWLEDFADELGLTVYPAPISNLLGPRLEGVRSLLTNNVGGKPGLLVSPRCAKTRQGFNNGYVMARQKLSNGTMKLKDEPDKKSPFSHVHDALQYLVGGLKKASGILDDIDTRARLRKQAGGVKYGGYAGAGR